MAGGLQGASRSSGEFLDRWLGSTERWSGRIAAGRALDWAWNSMGRSPAQDQFVSQATASTASPASAALRNISSSALSYRQLLNLGKSAEELARTPGSFEYHTVGWNDVFKKGQYADAVRRNFSRAFQPSTHTGGLSTWQYLDQKPGEFFRRTVVNDNFRRIADTLREGKNPGSGLMSALGLGLLGYDVLATTHEAYQLGKSRENGTLSRRLETLGLTAKAFAGSAFKNVVAWEASTIGFAVGASIFCVGASAAWLPIVGGVLTGALAATLTKKGLSYFLPDPKRPEPPGAQVT
jgi:hypothetical protein